MRTFTSTFFSLIGLLVFTQNPSTSKDSILLDNYSAYFELPRETLFTHLNKTTFAVGEHIWFKTYAHDRHFDNTSKKTTNINVGIYDSNGKLIKNDLWLAQDGSSNGNIFIDSTFIAGDYYIKTSTNWMKNFKEDDAFVQKISILSPKISDEVEESIANSYDLQFLPEGGHIVNEVINSVGFKIVNANGKGVKIEGKIYDDTNTEVSSFESNEFGIGKFLLLPKKGSTYTVRVNFSNGDSIAQTINGIKNQGIAIQVNNRNDKNLIITLNTNNATLKSIEDKAFKLAVHKNGLLKFIPFTFDNKKTKSFVIPYRDLYADVNIITLFDADNKPLLERIIFNKNYKSSTANYGISVVERENDSIVFSISNAITNFTRGSKSLSNLSISVLPETALGYEPDHNMLSANYLKPYLKGQIESPSYYFNNINSKKVYDLDLLLLTQGWSRYDWNSVFNDAPKPIYNFENGVSLKGKLQSPQNVNALKIQSPELLGNDWLDISLDTDNTFKVDNFFPLKDEDIRISYVDKDGDYKKPKLYITTVLQNHFGAKLLDEDIKIKAKTISNRIATENVYDQRFFNEVIENLDEVLIETRVIKVHERPAGIIAPSFTFKENYTQVTEDLYKRFLFITDLLDYYDFGIRNKPVYYLDGARIFDTSVLDNLRTSNFEGIIVDNTGLGQGIDGTNGVIRIYSRITPLIDTNLPDSFTNISKIENGFTKSKSFYNPKYKAVDTPFFRAYGTIGWLPNVNFENDNKYTFKLPDIKSESITFFIEGYDADENLVSQQVVLDIN